MAPRSIPVPRPSRLLDVETLHPAPLDMPGRRWPPRLSSARGRPGGRLPLRPSPPAPRPSPTGVGIPRTRPYTASSGNTSRPTWPRPRKQAPWAMGCPRMSRPSSGVTSSAASWRTGSLGPGAPVVVTSSWSGWRAIHTASLLHELLWVPDYRPRHRRQDPHT